MNQATISGESTLEEKRYRIAGMTCGSCVNSVREKLSSVQGVEEVQVDLAKAEALVLAKAGLDEEHFSSALAGSKYSLAQIDSASEPGDYSASAATTSGALANAAPPLSSIQVPVVESAEDRRGFFEIYRPLFTIVGLIALVTVLAQAPFENGLDTMLWMRHFMAGFFIVFSAFKLLDVSSFADSYAMYDLLAARWKGWGMIYPFVELGLGLAYLINFAPVLTNWLTIVILGFSAIGVIKSVLDKRKIRCACLGSVWNLPMSTVTIVEDLSMVLMAAWMLWML